GRIRCERAQLFVRCPARPGRRIRAPAAVLLVLAPQQVEVRAERATGRRLAGVQCEARAGIRKKDLVDEIDWRGRSLDVEQENARLLARGGSHRQRTRGGT